MKTPTSVWNSIDHLDSEEAVAAYVAAAVEDGDSAVLAAAITDVARLAKLPAHLTTSATIPNCDRQEEIAIPPSDTKAATIAEVCAALASDRLDHAASIVRRDYPFTPLANAARRCSDRQAMRLFVRDGFIDRYTGRRLVFPGALRLLSHLLPTEFPFHPNWKSDVCHFAFYELFPTIDHIVPVSRGGADDASNWVTTSMLRNAAKANFTLEELGWNIFPPGALARWDGMTSWFLAWMDRNSATDIPDYLRRWAVAARFEIARTPSP